MEQRKIRVLIAKVGLDGHDRGAKIVARFLRDAGMEVIYTGLRQTVDQVVNATIQEDTDVLGLSFLAGDHMVLIPKVIDALIKKGKDDVVEYYNPTNLPFEIWKRFKNSEVEITVKKLK